MWNLNNNTTECIYKEKQTHRYRKQTCGCQRREVSGEGQIRGMGLTDTIIYVKSISNKDTLYSTGHYTHCLVIPYNGV